MAVLLQAGLDGVKRELTPTPAVNSNIYVMNEDERTAAKISDLPSTLHNALKELRKDEVVKEALGEHIFEWFLRNKRSEWLAYKTHVTQFEFDRYLRAL